MDRYYAGHGKPIYSESDVFRRIDHVVYVGFVDNQDTYPLLPRRNLVDHSPRLDWGDSGSGSAQLALSILADFTSDDRLALVWHQSFKADIIAKFKADFNFVLEGKDIDAWLVGNEAQIYATLAPGVG